MVTLTLQSALFFVLPASGPTAAAKSSNMIFTMELSVENCALTVPDLQPLPSVSTSGSATLTEEIVQAPLGGAVAVAAGAASTATAERMRRTAVTRNDPNMAGKCMTDHPGRSILRGIYVVMDIGATETLRDEHEFPPTVHMYLLFSVTPACFIARSGSGPSALRIL